MVPSALPRKLAILLVEDQEADAFLTAQLLEDARHEHEIHVVKDGPQALAFLRREGPHQAAPTADLILLDLNLPGLHGRDVLRLMRAGDGTDAPIIIVSGAREERVGEYLHAGAVDYVMKGNASKLCEAVDGAFDASAALQRLSPSQRRVLRHIAEGLNTQQIAERLGVSVKTVESHRAEVIKRLDIRTVAGLVRFAMQVGLVTLRHEPRSITG